MEDLYKEMSDWNENVGINNFFVRHLGMSFDEWKDLSTVPKTVYCSEHLEENCEICANKKYLGL